MAGLDLAVLIRYGNGDVLLLRILIIKHWVPHRLLSRFTLNFTCLSDTLISAWDILKMLESEV